MSDELTILNYVGDGLFIAEPPCPACGSVLVVLDAWEKREHYFWCRSLTHGTSKPGCGIRLSVTYPSATVKGQVTKLLKQAAT